MSDERDNEERPCLHCMMVELIDQFFAENPATADEPNTIDTDEVIAAVAKTVAELTTCTVRGAISLNSSTHLPPIAGSLFVKPVM